MTIDINRPDFTLGLVGLGTMGKGIAQVAAEAGLRLLLYDVRSGAASAARAAVQLALPSVRASLDLQVVDTIEQLAPCHVIIEAIQEDMELKRKLFLSLEAVVNEECILASNTSSLTITAIAATCRRPARVVGAHFSNPVPIKRIVEVVDGMLGDSAAGDALMALARRMGVRPLRVKDTPGFVVNHNQRGFALEALRILGEGIAAFYEIDRIVCEGAGFRLGPFAMMDSGGLDIVQAVSESIYSQYFHEPRFRPSFLLRQFIAAGLLGRKAGRGFYTYDGNTPRPMPIAPLPAARPVKVWVNGGDSDRGAQVAELVRSLGGTVDVSARPARNALCVVAPLGCDATTAALAHDLDPARTVAIDSLLGLRSRRTLMTNPLTDPGMRDAAHGLFGSDGVPVSVIQDSPGFVAQRIVAMVVNVACHAAQQGIASPADVDCSYGQAYAKGPLTLGDEVGPRNVLTVLENMFQFYCDPVYRPSPWLKRRALLGVSLMTPDNLHVAQ